MRSKKLSAAVFKTTTSLLLAVFFVLAYAVLDGLGETAIQQQSQAMVELADMGRAQAGLSLRVEEFARGARVPMKDLEEGLAELRSEQLALQNANASNNAFANLLLGGNSQMHIQTELVVTKVTEFAQKMGDFKAADAKFHASKELKGPGQALEVVKHRVDRNAALQELRGSLNGLEVAIADASQEASHWTDRLQVILLGIRIGLAVATLIFILNALVYVRRRIFSPLKEVVRQTVSIAEGDLSRKVNLGEEGPVTEMSGGVNQLVDNMRTAAEFAYSVGEGDLGVELDLSVNENIEEPRANLALALANMRDRLKDFAEEEEKRKWAADGLAYFVEILRADYEDLESMGGQIISGMVNYLSANQGALYVVETNHETEEQYIRSLAAHAWGHPHKLQESFGLDEGLVGAVVQSGRTIYMTDLPESYSRIRSGLGDAQPRNILIIPLTINEMTVGAIELASFELFRDYEIDFIKKVGENVATSINGVQTSLKTRLLLVQSQELAAKLTEQEQAVRKNLSQLEAAQAQMQANQMELDGVLSAIDKSMAMAEFSLNGQLKEANNAFLKLMGYRLSEARGKTHADFVPRSGQHADAAREVWESLKQGRYRSGEFKCINAEGAELWVYASYNPILGADARPKKILFLASDITAQKISALDFEGQINAINRTNAMAELDLDGNFQTANELYEKLLGYKADELAGSHHRMVVPESELGDGSYFDRWEKLKQGRSVEGEFQLKVRDGRRIWVRGSFNPIFDLEGNPHKVISVSVDITAQKEMEMQIKEQLEQMASQEEELRQNMEEMQATHEEMDRNQVEMNGILNSIDKSMAMIEYDLDGVVMTVNNSFMELTGYSFVEIEGKPHSIFLPEEESQEEQAAFWQALRRGEFQRGNFKRVGKEGKEIWLNAVYNPIPGRDGQPFKIVQFATDITSQMQSALDYEGQLNAINKSNFMVAFDMDGKVIEANELFLRFSEYSSTDLVGKHHAVLLGEEDKASDALEAFWNRLKQSEFVNGEFKLLSAQGEEKWVRGSYNPILDLNGDPFKVIFVSVDISEEKELAGQIRDQLEQMAEQEEEMRRNMETLQETTELLEQRELEMSGQLNAIDSTLATVEFDPDGQVLAANDIFLEIMQYSAEEIIGKKHAVFVEEGHAKTLEYRQMWKNIKRGIAQSGEYKYVTAKGEEVWVLATTTPVLGRDGKPFKAIQLATEITDSKLMSVDFEGQVAAINRSNAVAEFDMEGRLTEANGSFQAMVHWKLQDLQGKSYVDFLAEEDKAAGEKLWEKFKEGQYVEGEFKWIEGRERELWVNGTFNPILNLEGEAYKVVLMATDITQQKMLQMENSMQLNMLAKKEQELRKSMKEMVEAQERIRQSEAEIRGQLNAINATNAKAEYDLEGHVTLANSIFLAVTGYGEDELLGQSHAALLFEEDLEDNTLLWKRLGEGEALAGEFRYRRKDGSEAWLQATFTPMLDGEGKPYKVLSLASDITERKGSEAEIVEANEKLNNTLHELTTAQDQLILSEKMASLGQLVAGVAHEVNTPIAAVKASVRNMARILPQTLRELPGLLEKIPSELIGIFNELVETSVSSDLTLSTKEERKYKKAIQQMLDELGIENSYEIASSLVSVRVLEGIERFLPLIEEPDASEYLDLAYRLGQLKVNMDNIDTAAEKTSKIVFALKSYSHVQSADNFVMTSLKDSVDLILTVYQNQLKYGIEVVRNYVDIPEVPVYPDELGQVWTNIIHNAVQAMKNEGKLTIDILQDGDLAVVRISDTGPGIPQEIQERIFQPFFTTKPQGEGTGLGLDICRKIVEKHGGRLEVDSEPGRTTFITSLPFVQPEPETVEAETTESQNGQANGQTAEKVAVAV